MIMCVDGRFLGGRASFEADGVAAHSRDAAAVGWSDV